MSAVQRPLVVREEKSRSVGADEARRRVHKFLTAEAGAQSAPGGVAQQIQKLLNALAPQASSSDDSDGDYSCEGNAKMAFSYAGGDPRLDGQLLLVDKSRGGDGDGAQGAAELGRRQAAGDFSARVVGRLLGARYVLERRHVRVGRGFLERLGALAARQRPAHRAGTQVDCTQQYAALMRNMLAGQRAGGAHTVTVELKPKWGFLPRSGHIAPAHAVKRQVCRYCMQQHLKRGAAGVSALCMLDLFSDRPARVEAALRCLAQSPQNNMRVFLDGSPVDGRFADRVPRWAALQRALARILLAERVLRTLADCQRRLDALDVEGLFPVYQRALASGELPDREPEIAEWLDAVAAFQDRPATGAPPGARQAVLEFLLSMVLKDISLMVTIEGWPPRDEEPAGDDEALPEYRVAVVDTEPKKLANMPRYLARDQAVVARYLELHPDPAQWKTCQE
ncbi:hypothetical protein H4R18_001772 [Coemansia javaensis]|uniref:Inositol-pentakisphosphate 2-kinase n=1 Tax=Coemansia javaensis TaxID=2761396 RepID=A0A9W8HG95_9FUNG|nr:hypothetical protein H4R18_001772 [Coemansia javaensis]